jgi:hypothetical protein
MPHIIVIPEAKFKIIHHAFWGFFAQKRPRQGRILKRQIPPGLSGVPHDGLEVDKSLKFW